MPEISKVTVCLRVAGDALDPDEITRVLGIDPTSCARKGDKHRTASDREVVAPIGSWRLEADTVGNLNARITGLLAKLPDDPFVWRELTSAYSCDIFCGLFVRHGNEGTELEPELLSMIGARGLRLGFDLYDLSE